MKYLSVCSGIEAATQAWHPFGWKPVAFSEIEKFPSDSNGVILDWVDIYENGEGPGWCLELI